MKVDYVNMDRKFSLLDNAMIDDQKYILGSNGVLCGLVDLCTYGWKFFPKVTYEPLDYLPLEQKPTDLTTAEIIRKTMFPTIGEGEKDETIRYYGSISSGSQTLYMISVPRGSKKVVFKEGEVVKIEVDAEEPNDEVLLWFVISKDGVSNINLSYYSWLRSQLPHRNYLQHVVGLDYPIEVVEEEGGYWFDKTSGTILANTEPLATPLLDAMLKKQDDSWSPRVHYKKGDIVGEWIAVEDNVNSYPSYSTSWISKRVMDSFRGDISIVSCPNGEVVPTLIPTTTTTTITLESLKLDYGYVLSGYVTKNYEAYVNKTYTIENVEVKCERLGEALVVPTEKSEPIIEVYINGDPVWPKKNASDIGITRVLKVPLGGSFMTDVNLSTKHNIGEITGVTKKYLGENEEVLGEDTKVDSLVLGEVRTPILSDTMTLPCKKVRYNISLTYYDIQLIIGEYSGFYINTTGQTSLNNETKHFYMKATDPSFDTCSVDLFMEENKVFNKFATLVVSPGKTEDSNIIGATTISLEKKDDVFVLSTSNPVRSLKFNIYGS